MAIHNRQIEYRIKPVTRYIVTRHERGDLASGSEQIGNEYDTADVAYQVGYAVCAMEHQRLGWPVGDERIKYPEDPAVKAQQIAQIPAGQGLVDGLAQANFPSPNSLSRYGL